MQGIFTPAAVLNIILAEYICCPIILADDIGYGSISVYITPVQCHIISLQRDLLNSKLNWAGKEKG
jgi:hypothetical protein